MATVQVSNSILRQILSTNRRPFGFDFYFDPLKVLDELNLATPSPRPVADKEDDKKADFKVMLNVIHFANYQVRVAVQGRKVNVDGSHPATVDAHGQIVRQFNRQIDIPENIDPDLITADLSRNGILTIRAPTSPSSPVRGGRLVSVQYQQPINGSGANIQSQPFVSIPIQRTSSASNNNTTA